MGRGALDELQLKKRAFHLMKTRRNLQNFVNSLFPKLLTPILAQRRTTYLPVAGTLDACGKGGGAREDEQTTAFQCSLQRSAILPTHPPLPVHCMPVKE